MKRDVSSEMDSRATQELQKSEKSLGMSGTKMQEPMYMQPQFVREEDRPPQRVPGKKVTYARLDPKATRKLQEELKTNNIPGMNLLIDDDDDDEDVELDSYETPLDVDDFDEYMEFKRTLIALQAQDPALYTALTSRLTEEQQTSLQEVLNMADRRAAAKGSIITIMEGVRE
jgi:hypothetical protein